MRDPKPDSRERPLGTPWSRSILGILLAILLVGGLLWVAGPRQIITQFGGLSQEEAGRLLVVTVFPMIVWGVSLQVVLTGIDVSVTTPRAIGLFIASVFLNNITPFGQAGGDPPSALLISHSIGATAESSLAGITSLNLANRLAALVLGVIGIVVLVGPARPATGPWLEAAFGLAVSGIVFALLAWLYVRRTVVVAVLSPLLATLSIRIARLLPGVVQPTRPSVRERVRGFVRSIERLASDPWRLVTILVLGLVGHVIVAAILWLSLLALEAPVPFAIVLIVLPTARMSGLAPTPGGSGGAIALLAGLLTATTGVPLATTTGAAVLYRTVAFWIPTVLGGALTIGFVVTGASETG